MLSRELLLRHKLLYYNLLQHTPWHKSLLLLMVPVVAAVSYLQVCVVLH
jgi:hypothetical protein